MPFVRPLAALALSLSALAAPAMALDLHRGVGVHEWLNWSPLAADGSYSWPPYRDETAWLSGYRDLSDWPSTDVFATIAGLGFDFVRLTVDPGPLLASSGDKRDVALGVIRAAIQTIADKNLKVVLDLHAVRQVPQYGADFILPGPGSENLAAYQDMVAAVATMAVAVGVDTVALEPFNEPQYYPCEGDAMTEWNAVMASTVARIRTVSPDLTIIATGACGGSIAGLEQLDPGFDDPNVLYSFHMYEPHSFTHQGLDSDDDWLSGLPWPASTGTADAVMAHLSQALSADGVDGATAQAALAAALPRVEDYFAQGEGAAALEARFDRVTAWAHKHAIALEKLFMGEFGATLMFPDGSKGAFEDSRSRYMAAVRQAAEQRGIAWSVWEFSNPFGMSLIVPQGPAVPDENLLKALGLSPH